VDIRGLDLPTCVTIAAPSLTEAVIDRLAGRGFEGVRASHGYVVQQLVDAEPTISGLARTLGITQQGASKQVVELERLGYAERVPVAGDQRARAVRLTARGREMLLAAREVRAELEREVVARAGPERVAHAKEVLGVVLDMLGLAGRVGQRAVPPPRDGG